MDATLWAQTWAQVALVIFLGIVIYLKVPGMIAKSLDARASKIADELDSAKRLREEAQSLLAEYQKKRKEAEAEAAEIVAVAKREAEALAEEAKQKTADYVARRTAGVRRGIGDRVGRRIALLIERGEPERSERRRDVRAAREIPE
jgi:F-type H+-transporting ATPase subunit b